MDEQTAARHRKFVERLTFALGAFDLLRLPPEVLAVLFWLQVGLKSTYQGLVGMDVALGLASLLGGWALRRRPAWGWMAATGAWGAVAANSLLVFLVLIPDVSFRSSTNKGSLLGLLRIAFCVASLLPVPYVLWVSFTVPRPGIRSRFFLMCVLGVGGLVSWLATAFAIEVHPLTLLR